MYRPAELDKEFKYDHYLDLYLEKIEQALELVNLKLANLNRLKGEDYLKSYPKRMILTNLKEFFEKKNQHWKDTIQEWQELSKVIKGGIPGSEIANHIIHDSRSILFKLHTLRQIPEVYEHRSFWTGFLDKLVWFFTFGQKSIETETSYMLGGMFRGFSKAVSGELTYGIPIMSHSIIFVK